jgi:phosphohistidine phosphatase
MIVCFFRHGPAVEARETDLPDDERPLTEEGVKRTRQAARGLRSLGHGLERVVTSPLPRALRTAELLAAELGLPGPKVSEELRPGTTASRILELLRQAGGKSTVLVGHEPSLSAAAATFAGAGKEAAVRLRKAGAAVATLRTLDPVPRGTLDLLLSGKVLRRLAACPK